MRADRLSPTIAALRKFKPTKFSVALRDGTVRDVPLSTRSNRWEQLLAILDKLAWKTIEAQDEDGRVLGVVEPDSIDDDDDDDDDTDYDPVAASVERMSKVMLTVMVQTQQETRKGMESALRAHTDMAKSMLDAMGVVQDSYQLAMRVRDMQEVTGGGVDAGSSENVMKMIAMAMSMGKPSAPAVINVPPRNNPPTPKRTVPPRPAPAPNGTPVDVKS